MRAIIIGIFIIICLVIIFKSKQPIYENFGEKYHVANKELHQVINIPLEENPDTSFGHLVGKNIHVRLDDKCNVMYEDYLPPSQQGIYGCTQWNCPKNLENSDNKTCWLCCNYH